MNKIYETKSICTLGRLFIFAAVKALKNRPDTQNTRVRLNSPAFDGCDDARIESKDA